MSGLVQPFSGLTELVNPILHSIVSSANTTEPVLVTASQIANDGAGGVEMYEGRLVRMNGVAVTGSGSWGANTNYPLIDATDTTQLRIDNNTNLVGAPIPASSFDVVGVVGQFINASPYIGGYQVLPRFTSDILSTGPIFVAFPVESDISPTSLRITWQTLKNGTTRVRYGKMPSFELGVAGNDTLRISHSVRLNGLDPATVYYIQAYSVSAGDTSVASTLIASTASPAQTTGAINVYFNKSVNTDLARPQPALGNQDLVSRVLARITNARRSIDVALYSLSSTPGDNIATALVGAKNRGVKVRVICEYDNKNTNAFNSIIGNGVPLIDDRFDAVNFGAGLMHNKFFVIDGRNGAPESVWVWTGSWNPTDPGTNNDYQNAVEIQDAALAGAYTREFNEMWGSSTDIPNASSSRFGARKTDNTPHRFIIGGKSVECYFSPSDRMTSHIISTINAAQHSVGFALLTLTRTDIRSALIAQKTGGRKVRGILDNNTDSGSQYNNLLAGGVDVRLKSGTGFLFHHKYGIFDAEDPIWNSVTITGSHNWTSSAENSNNENTLIIQDAVVTNQYLQEFAARYYQFGGTDTIRVDVEEADPRLPSAFSLSQNYPNPFNASTKIQFQLPVSGRVTLKVFDILGREVTTLVNEQRNAGKHEVEFGPTNVASGVYVYRLEVSALTGVNVLLKKMLVLR